MAARIGEVSSFSPRGDGTVGEDAIAAYKRDGVICLRGVFDDAWLAMVEEGIDLFMEREAAKEGPLNVVVKADGDDGTFRYATMMWQTMEPFREAIFESRAPDIFGSVLETSRLNLYYDFLLIKQRGCRSAVTPWHQDHSYYCLNGRKLINCWTALDPIPHETALRFVMGSHRNDALSRAVHFNPGDEYPGTIKERPLPPDFDAMDDAWIISCATQPGDTLVWNSRTFHSAPGNHLDRRRAALSLNFAGDDITYYDTPQEPDPPVRGEGLVDGGPITCKTFPELRVW